ncbi:Alanine--tRNA ligase, cytoplasmic [Cucumispora dikerogammari]|nr:Alanine--tRNA ligase, cytoplasmic [Cucumispora dikerogammari]
MNDKTNTIKNNNSVNNTDNNIPHSPLYSSSSVNKLSTGSIELSVSGPATSINNTNGENKITREKLITKFTNYFLNPYILITNPSSLKSDTKVSLNLPHIETSSSSIIPEDTTLLFVNSGMVQFKDALLNPNTSNVKRTFSIQRCIRAGGKHNDLDDVGMDSYHHTFFEMMGNWSFGDYFKKEAILMAYTLLIELGLEKERMFVTYFCKRVAMVEVFKRNGVTDEAEINALLEEYYNHKTNVAKSYQVSSSNVATLTCAPTVTNNSGKKKILNSVMKELDLINDNLQTDIETHQIWLTLLSPSQIIPAGMKDNFWEMGETGPCGPCTEVHYNRLNLPQPQAAELVNTDQNDVIEIWNIVFIQYYRKPNKELEILENKSVDTGMGLERVLGILNNGTNYDTEIFSKIFSHLNIFNDKKEENKQTENIINYRIIADHARTIAVALFYEIDFSNTGRGYVLRRIMRRLLRSFYEIKANNNNENILDLIVIAAKTLNLNIKDTELTKVNEEIVSFNKTLEKGTKALYDIIKTQTQPLLEINSEMAFDLTTTYGLPLDYLKDICRNKNIFLNLENYDDLFSKFKLLSMKTTTHDLVLSQSEILKLKNKFSFTEEFVESEILESELKFIKFQNSFYEFKDMKNISENEIRNLNNHVCALIFKATNFYSEKGGQVGDTGVVVIKSEDILAISGEEVENINTKNVIEILDTQRQNDFTLHKCLFNEQIIKSTGCFSLHFNVEKRNKTRANHTATHLLNYFLLMDFNNKNKDMVAHLPAQSSLSTHLPSHTSAVENNEEPVTATDDKSTKVSCQTSLDEYHSLDSSGPNVTPTYIETIQAGSLVNADKLRFDYETFNKTPDLVKIEEQINQLITKNLSVKQIEIPLNEINQIKDFKITKLKNEKYPSDMKTVKIIRISSLTTAEFCGGTHVKNLEKIKFFIIQSDKSLSKGIRRLTAFTGEKAINFLDNFLIKFNSAKTSKDLEKINENEIPLKFKKDFLEKKEDFKKKEILKSKNFYKRISEFIDIQLSDKNVSEISNKIHENEIEIAILQKKEEFVSEKEFIKNFNKLNGVLLMKLKRFSKINIIVRGVSYENQMKNFVIFGGPQMSEIKQKLENKKREVNLNKTGEFLYCGSYYEK